CNVAIRGAELKNAPAAGRHPDLAAPQASVRMALHHAWCKRSGCQSSQLAAANLGMGRGSLYGAGREPREVRSSPLARGFGAEAANRPIVTISLGNKRVQGLAISEGRDL